MTTAGRIGSRAGSPGSHTLSCPSSSCSLDYYIEAARCARKPRRKPTLPTPTGRRLGRSRTLTASHLLARAQVPGLCDRVSPPAASGPRRTAVTLTAAAPPSPPPPPPSARRVALRRRPPSCAPLSLHATPGVRRRRCLLLVRAVGMCACVCVAAAAWVVVTLSTLVSPRLPGGNFWLESVFPSSKE